MRCPYCHFRDSKVTDSRANDDGIRRRRQCIACGERFSTVEAVQFSSVQILKRDGRMVAAVEAIGRGVEAFEGEPFTLKP